MGPCRRLSLSQSPRLVVESLPHPRQRFPLGAEQDLCHTSTTTNPTEDESTVAVGLFEVPSPPMRFLRDVHAAGLPPVTGDYALEEFGHQRAGSSRARALPSARGVGVRSQPS